MDGVSRQAKIKNKNPAPVQVTAEQILREANERQDRVKAKPVVILADPDELNEYHQDKRKAFEDAIRANRNVIGNWIRYATWEEAQGALDRARSVLERAIEVDARNPSVWLRYIEMEMKAKNVNSARNVFDRVVSFLPRVDMFWYKYVYMEEILDNVGGARQVFERWMKWQPSEDAWMGYVKFEKRYKETELSRNVYKRFVTCMPQPKNWIKWAKFEEQLSNNDYARQIYEECISTTPDEIDQNVYVSFAKFEARMKEYERARGIFKYALEKLGKEKTANLYNEYTVFEKMFGDKQGIEDVVMTKRRAKYETDLDQNPRNYDTWFSYARLEEDVAQPNRIRDLYERAISHTPLTQEKRYWRRYIYLWLFYAAWEEQHGDATRARAIYEKAIAIVPHAKFTFAKLWTGYAGLLVRDGKLDDARKVLGMAIGRYPKPKLFKSYIQQELALREFDRTRTLYERYLAYAPSVCQTWIKYAELEAVLGEDVRARGVYAIALNQTELDMPEILWKAGIDFEVACGETDRVRVLYERLLQKTEHVKVWISYAGYETTTEEGTKQQRTQKSRDLFERAYTLLKTTTSPQSKPQRMLLLESWKTMEETYGTAETLQGVEAKMPRVVKKRRKVDGGVWEEYFDYIFPDDTVDQPNFKLLQMAQAWKEKAAREKSEQMMAEAEKGQVVRKDGDMEKNAEESAGEQDGDQMDQENEA